MTKVRFPDLFVILAVIILFVLGLFVLYSTEPLSTDNSSWLDSLVIRQILFFLVAILVSGFLIVTDPQIGKTLLFQLIVFTGSLGLLVGLFIFGAIVNDTQRWYPIGSFLFQPSEFVKIVSILWGAYWLVQDTTFIKKALYGGGGILLLISLILLQPDFGAAIIILVSFSLVLFVWLLKYKAGRLLLTWAILIAIIAVLAVKFSFWWLMLSIVPFLWLLKNNLKVAMYAVAITIFALFAGFSLSLAWKYSVIPDYVKERILVFSSDDEQFQTRQAKIAIGSGRITGKGVAQGTQSRLQFLPEYTTDFLFAAYAEERGFIGVLLLFGVYLFLFLRLLYLALMVKDEYARLVIIGLTTKLWFETLVNIGMNMGIMPTKGVALPFMSYGGSSLLSNAIIIGIILSLYRYEAKRATI